MVKKVKHTHKYIRDKFEPSGRVIFRCALPGCNHYLFEQFVLNKITLCWVCNEEFVIGTNAATLKKPHCRKCTAGYESPDVDVMDFVEGIVRGD